MPALRKNYDKAVAMYNDGISIVQIANYFSITRQAMWEILKRRGVKTRKRGKWFNIECKVKGCGRPVRARGYCSRHLWQIYRHGKIVGVEIKSQHGMSNTPEYNAWKYMIQRCTNPNNISYKNYGGRGIRVCERWKRFISFFNDLGKKPSENHSLERIDVDKNYCPENCRWADHSEQARNKRIDQKNSTGVVGVTFDVKRKKYKAQITANNKTIFLGRFNSLEDAAEAREQAEIKYWN